eukprot:6470577-Amphidinium_carterae.2
MQLADDSRRNQTRRHVFTRFMVETVSRSRAFAAGPSQNAAEGDVLNGKCGTRNKVSALPAWQTRRTSISISLTIRAC